MIEKPRAKTFTKNPIIGTKFTIAVSSAKGGVGKSTFASNLALALKKQGCKVGLLDADIYGPSLPKLFDIGDKPESDGQRLIPILKYDIQCMSIGFLTDEQTPMIWRGPMVTSAIKTFTQKVAWKDLDFIIVDMPPWWHIDNNKIQVFPSNFLSKCFYRTCDHRSSPNHWSLFISEKSNGHTLNVIF